ncbi:hypothetical protein [Pseudonocardia sp. NPDC049635]|uniref:hypothetical protein n=1 Tax=Pseudonocardia sp. NPDC049635 TaxID=3155506 RepID=UPI0033C54ADC
MTSTPGRPVRLSEPSERFGTVSSATARQVHAAGLGPHGFAVYAALTMFVDPRDGAATVDDVATITGLTRAEVEAAVSAGEAVGMWDHPDLAPLDVPLDPSGDVLSLDLPPSPYDLLPGLPWLRARERHLRAVPDLPTGGTS